MLRCRGEFTRVGYDISPLKTGVKASPSQDKKITCAMASLLAVDMSFEPSGRKTKKNKKRIEREVFTKSWSIFKIPRPPNETPLHSRAERILDSRTSLSHGIYTLREPQTLSVY